MNKISLTFSAVGHGAQGEPATAPALAHETAAAGSILCADASPASVECRMAFGIPASASAEIMYMPAGRHKLTPLVNGKPDPLDVLVEPASALAVEGSRVAVLAKGKRPYFDFNHDDGPASFWPDRFYWGSIDGKTGVIAHGEWSATGKASVEGKEYRQFSPGFDIDNTAGHPAHIITNPDRSPNFGGLVNDPAFKTISPLWAKDAAGAHQSSTNQNQNTMTPEELAALQKQNRELLAEVQDLKGQQANIKAKNESDSLVAAEIKAKEAQIALNTANLKTAEIEARNKELEAADKKRRETDADAAIGDAVKRGAIAAKDEEQKTMYRDLAIANPKMLSLITSLKGNQALSQRITPAAGVAAKAGDVEITGYGCRELMKGCFDVVAKNTKIELQAGDNATQKGILARETAHVYRQLMAKKDDFLDMPLSVIAADYADPAGNLGTLSGTLVIQRTLELFQIMFPVINAVFTDFSDQPGLYNQTEVTRILGVPAVQNYDSTLDANGNTKGWLTVSPALSTDVPITLNQHIGIPIVFDSNILASTARRLFDESSEPASYALAKNIVEQIYSLMTPSNFNAYAAVNGAKVPVAYAQYIVALADFRRQALTQIAAIMNPNEVPLNNRFVAMISSYAAQLANDPTLVTFRTAPITEEFITDNVLPKMATFKPIEAPNLLNTNATANLVGFAGHKAAIAIKARVPSDYTSILPGASYGNVSVVTDPKINLSVLLVEFVNHDRGTAQRRMQLMFGKAVGDKRGGLCITSQ